MTSLRAPEVPAGIVRTRFCPSPTGMVHVGLMRTALFNWAHARHSGGQAGSSGSRTPTPAATPRSPTSTCCGSLRWLGIDWDEGPDVGGPNGPLPVQRHGHLRRGRAKLVAGGHAYESSPRTRRWMPGGWPPGRTPSSGTTTTTGSSPTRRSRRFGPRAQAGAPAADADEDLAWTDLVRGEIRFAAGSVPDFVLVRGNGAPLYPFVNPVTSADGRHRRAAR